MRRPRCKASTSSRRLLKVHFSLLSHAHLVEEFEVFVNIPSVCLLVLRVGGSAALSCTVPDHLLLFTSHLHFLHSFLLYVIRFFNIYMFLSFSETKNHHEKAEK